MINFEQYPQSNNSASLSFCEDRIVLDVQTVDLLGMLHQLLTTDPEPEIDVPVSLLELMEPKKQPAALADLLRRNNSTAVDILRQFMIET